MRSVILTEDVPPFTVVESPGPVEAYRVPEAIMRKVQAANGGRDSSAA